MGHLPHVRRRAGVDAGRMSNETFEIPLEVAEIYEERFVPALFADWAPLTVDAADPAEGDRVLDVACGTGIVARTVADRIGPGGLTGVDLYEAMLTVAQRVRPDLDWRQGDAAALPFADESYDAVLCQFALMFFPNRERAVSELARVARGGGRVVVSVPAELSAQTGAYGPLVDLAVEHAGPEAVSLLGVYWSCGDPALLRGLFREAG